MEAMFIFTTDLYVAVSVLSLLMRAALSLSVSLPAVCQSSKNTPWGDIAVQRAEELSF